MARGNKSIDQKYNTPFASNVRKLMDERRITQDALAKNIGKTRQTVSQYANGISEPSYETLIKIANYFCVSIDYLLGVSPYQTTDKSQEFVCKYTGLSEASVKYLKLLMDVQAGKTVHPKALEEISKYEADEKEKDDEYYAGYYEYKCNQYSEDIDERHGAARRYGIEDEDDISAIAKAAVDDAKEYDKKLYENNKRDVIEEYRRYADLPVCGLNAILSSELQKDILTNLSFFLQLGASQKPQEYGGQSTFEISLASKNDEEIGFGAQLSLESVAWGFMRQAENSLADLRHELKGGLTINDIF